MRDRRYGPILIVRIECGGATAAAAAAVVAAAAAAVVAAAAAAAVASAPEREQAATGLHRSFDAICAIYDTANERGGSDPDAPLGPLDLAEQKTRGRISRRIIVHTLSLIPYR